MVAVRMWHCRCSCACWPLSTSSHEYSHCGRHPSFQKGQPPCLHAQSQPMRCLQLGAHNLRPTLRVQPPPRQGADKLPRVSRHQLSAANVISNHAASEPSLTAAHEMLEQSDIWTQTLIKYDAAQQCGAATQTETTTELVTDAGTGLAWVIRLATALKAKPSGPPPAEGNGPKPAWRNPFLPPEPELTVGQLSDTHTLVLNKFNVVPHHCLVVTRTFQPQSDPLNASDLAATWWLLKAMPFGGLAFYNCGPHSGRSQPHKHVQVVPLPLAPALPPAPPIQLTLHAAFATASVDFLEPFPVRSLPWQAAAVQLPLDPSPLQLAAACQALLSCCCRWTGKPSRVEENTSSSNPAPDPVAGATSDASDSMAGVVPNRAEGQLQASTQAARNGIESESGHGLCGKVERVAGAGEQLSYNVLLTTQWMVMVPRSQECDGPLAVNALGFAGTLLVRDQEGVEYVRSRGPSNVLVAVGYPWR